MKKHRGRFQAQGGGIEESEAWAQDEPLTKADGLELMHKLKNKLPEKEQDKRKSEFKKAERFVKNTEGVDALFHKSFRSRKHRAIRVDLEVKAGRAFIMILGGLLLYFWLIK